MNKFEKVTQWVIVVLLIALTVGAVGAFVWSWTWHNLVLAALSAILVYNYIDDINRHK